MGAQCFEYLKLIIVAQRYHLYAIQSPVPPRYPYPCFSARSVPFDEIVANPSDLKHVGKLLGCSDGLGMVILTR